MDDPRIDEISGDDPLLAAELAAAGQPVDDLTEPGRHFFRFAVHGQSVGFVGWEMVDQGVALLRSLVVTPSGRGQGAGTAIAHWALTRLGELGATGVYTLTTTAEEFLQRLGFVPTERAAAPQAVQGSRQFAGLCPTSAILMHRKLP